MSAQKAESGIYISSLPAPYQPLVIFSSSSLPCRAQTFVISPSYTLFPPVRLVYWPRHGPLHSFCSRGPRHYNIRCWPDYCRPCRRPNIPSYTTCQPAISLFGGCMDSMSLSPPSPLLTFTASRTKPSLVITFVGPRLATTNATLPPRTSSLCARPLSSMTSLVSSLKTSPTRGLICYSDFCIFAPPQPNSTIADTEGVEVAWCTKKGHGARGIAPDTISGIQVLNNPNYIQIVAFIKQENIYIQTGDYGGELDGWAQDGVRCVLCDVRCARGPDMLTSSWVTPLVVCVTQLLSARSTRHMSKPHIGLCSSLACKDCSCPIAIANMTLLDSWVEAWSE